jgi:endonuclease YncB( thermonuclease family)
VAPKPEPTEEQKDEPKPEPKGEEEEDRGRYDAVATVTRVVDGDTVEIEPDVDGNDSVRLIGVDTPETVDPGEDVEPYGPESSNYATSVLEGGEVELGSMRRGRTSTAGFLPTSTSRETRCSTGSS